MSVDHTIAWMKLDDWVKRVLELRGSDLHLVPGNRPTARVDGKLVAIDDMTLHPSQTRWVAVCMYPNGVEYQFQGGGYAHTSRKFHDVLADVTAASAGGDISVTLRFHAQAVPSLAQCDLPPVVTQLLNAPNGIVIVAGPHSSGKTTTLYALLNWINENRECVISTVERPRHYLLPRGKSILQQREVGLDGPTPAQLVAAAMHQDVDVLMLGEIEDFDTLGAVLHAAETGHLVLVQIHAADAREAVERILFAAPEGMQSQVKKQLAQTLRGVVTQRLVHKADGRGRAAIHGILGEGARKYIDGAEPDAGLWLARMQDAVARLLGEGKITAAEAERARREIGA